jgi:hypothetical protein
MLVIENMVIIFRKKPISQLVFSSVDIAKKTDKRKISEKIIQKYTLHIFNSEGGSILWDPVHSPKIKEQIKSVIAIKIEINK